MQQGKNRGKPNGKQTDGERGMVASVFPPFPHPTFIPHSSFTQCLDMVCVSGDNLGSEQAALANQKSGNFNAYHLECLLMLKC